MAGSSFIDPADPYGPLGNPFAVVIGENVPDLSTDERLRIAKTTNTPETVFVNSCQTQAPHKYEVNLTVYTPSGSEMGACAHGFLGAIQTLLQSGEMQSNSALTITTTLSTSAHATLNASGDIALGFQAVEPQELAVESQALHAIYGVSFGDFKNLGILSVGSPKLTLEVTPQIFQKIQANLVHINYESLLSFQDENEINGVHIFCRNPDTSLPEKCIQNNAYSGPENLADRATGVSNAAQISADNAVKAGQQLRVTQYSFDGPSAILAITKGEHGEVMVGGAAQLFNVQTYS